MGEKRTTVTVKSIKLDMENILVVRGCPNLADAPQKVVLFAGIPSLLDRAGDLASALPGERYEVIFRKVDPSEDFDAS